VEKVEELSGLIKRQNRHLTDLIDRILDINIWERDQVRLRLEETEVDPWIGDLAEAFRLKHPAVELHLQNPETGGSVAMDEVHMSTAMNNLLNNAVKYGSDPCKITLDLHTRGSWLEICVEDNGPGIRREELRHVFEKFYRGRESKQRVIRGLGLGLYYVKQIAEAHGGSISARSEPGKGATFCVKIPRTNGHFTG
jgi:signal transduction histidine kinase